MIHDEDFLSKCGKWLRTTLPPQRTPRNFQLYLNEILLPSLTGALQTTVSIETSRRWMIHAGYKYGAWSKDVFLDGHERHDVVEYRADFCRKWIELSKRMVSYTGPDMETVECPENSVLEPVVWLTHDESVFYANDDGGMIWTNSAHPDLPKKSRGRSIMVSDFLCPCHGRLYMPVGERQQYVRELLHIGKTQEGYWTSNNVVAQVKDKVLPAFAALHPGCLALITFDQSTNHAAFAPDALRTTSMNLNPGGKQDKMRDGWYGLNRTLQKMVFPEDHHVIDLRGKAKGIKAVLVERGAWKPSMRLTCGVAVDIPPSPAILECCARHCLASFDDFRSQKSVLEEIVTSAGHVCMFYPKYHCELNPIESYWGAAKWYARQHCDYSWNGLVRCVPTSLSSVPLSSIRKFFRRCSH
ncbi:hypothetical protein LEN26_012591 [Aphanomyces euteiches]|nr:hypothetical protein LEN26_012591 [Aphanomyces euteiches]